MRLTTARAAPELYPRPASSARISAASTVPACMFSAVLTDQCAICTNYTPGWRHPPRSPPPARLQRCHASRAPPQGGDPAGGPHLRMKCSLAQHILPALRAVIKHRLLTQHVAALQRGVVRQLQQPLRIPLCNVVVHGILAAQNSPSAWQRSTAGWCDSSSSRAGSQNSASRPHGCAHGAAGSQQLASPAAAPAAGSWPLCTAGKAPRCSGRCEQQLKQCTPCELQVSFS